MTAAPLKGLNQTLYHYKDVAASVEWLKMEITNKFQENINVEDSDLRFIFIKIDEAFEDVVTKENAHSRYDTESYPQDETDDNKCFTFEDIAASVEWLRNKIFRYPWEEEDFDFLYNTINEAFKDMVKKKETGKKEHCKTAKAKDIKDYGPHAWNGPDENDFK